MRDPVPNCNLIIGVVSNSAWNGFLKINQKNGYQETTRCLEGTSNKLRWLNYSIARLRGGKLKILKSACAICFPVPDLSQRIPGDVTWCVQTKWLWTRVMGAHTVLDRSIDSSICSYEILKQIVHHFREVLFCILSDIGSSSKEQAFDVTINPGTWSCEVNNLKYFCFNYNSLLCSRTPFSTGTEGPWSMSVLT